MPPRLITNLDYALSRIRSTESPQQPLVASRPRPGIFADRPLGPSAVVHGRTNIPSFSTRIAQSNVIFTQPQFYSPLHTPQNWQIPSKRREIYQWCRFFTENEPKVAAAIDFYSSFPMNGFTLQCDDPKIEKFFENLSKKLRMEYWAKLISREYHMLGDVFPFAEIECEHCHGSLVNEEGDFCVHPHGSIRRIVVMNPDWIDVQTNIMAEDPVITLLPDDDLKRIVWHKNPKSIYDRIPTHVKQLILAGKPIPLHNDSVSHLKFNPYPYGVYGTSLVRRLFKILAYKDKLMTAQWIVAERLILPVRIVKVGNDERPAGPSEIADVQQQLAQVANDPNLTLVTHHAFEYDWVGTTGKVLQISNEYDFVNKEILQGLMLNEALLSGEMPGYNSAAIGAEAIIQRMESWRRELGQWIEERIFKPVAQMKGFIDEEATKEHGEQLGEPVWIYPKIKWNELHLRDKTQHDQILLQLQERGLVSAQTTLEKLEYDYDQEVERIRYETAAQSFGQMGPGGSGGAGGAPPPMGGGLGGDMGGGPMGGGMGGDMGAPGGLGAPGAMPPAAGPGGPAPAAAPVGAGSAGKILTKKRAGSAQPKEEEVQPSNIRLTSLEQKLYRTITGMKLPFASFAQYPLGPYRADFAIPQLQLAIEADGEEWHKDAVAVAHDRQRDTELAYYGWTVVRFAERDIKDRIKDVEYTITSVVNDLWNKAIKRQEQLQEKRQSNASTAQEINSLVKMSNLTSFHYVALGTKRDIEKVMSGKSYLRGLIVESMVVPFDNDGLRPKGQWMGYPAFFPEDYPKPQEDSEQDGQADQGPRDKVD